MPTYLVERYLPGRDRAWLDAALAASGDNVAGVWHWDGTYSFTQPHHNG